MCGPLGGRCLVFGNQSIFMTLAVGLLWCVPPIVQHSVYFYPV